MAHFVLEGSASFALSAAATADLGALARGLPCAAPPSAPIELDVHPAPPGDPPPFLDQAPAPVMREDLVAALRAAGVDNLDAYPATLRDPRSGRAWTGYRVVNVIGSVSAVDAGASRIVGGGDTPPFIEALVLDEAAAAPHHAFRLREAPGVLVVSARVKRALEDAGFADLRFFGPAEWSG